MKILPKAAWSWALLGALQGCQAPYSATLDEARPEEMDAAVRKVMEAYSSTQESEGVFRTGWEEEPLEAARTALPSGARWLRARYEVWMRGAIIHVRARAEVFVHHGPHRKTWDRLGSRPFEESLFGRIVETLKRDSTK